MSARLLDTNIVSYWIRKHAIYRRYRRHTVGHDLYISFQTFAELHEWASLANWGTDKHQRFQKFLGSLTALHSDEVTCYEWSRIRTARRSQPISVADAWIAATAVSNGLELVTHNPGDFANIPGLTIISETP